MKLTDSEIKYLSNTERCDACGHLEALHNGHCCSFCMVTDCPCDWGKIPSDEKFTKEKLVELSPTREGKK